MARLQQRSKQLSAMGETQLAKESVSMPNSEESTIAEKQINMKCAAYCQTSREIAYIATSAVITLVTCWALIIVLEPWI